ncbi:MAG: hypothetical protein JO103_01370 [Candidatus Eremiobacteraeota bacterium]|nr:hypothetical protein [Candidatus Eremiobacteraeota bacterium]
MRVRPWTHLLAGAVLIALLSACGGNVAGTSPVPGGPASTLGADRTTSGTQIVFPPTPTPLPSPWPPCYCPPGHHPCPDIACASPDGTRVAAPALLTPPPGFRFTPPPQHCPTCPPGGYGSVSVSPAIICPDIACFQADSTKQKSDVLDRRGPQDS